VQQIAEYSDMLMAVEKELVSYSDIVNLSMMVFSFLKFCFGLKSKKKTVNHFVLEK